jgi:hypothetical protein
MRTPRLCRSLLAIAGRLVPPRDRTLWRTDQQRSLAALCTLIERGEVALHPQAELARFCLHAFTRAFWMRFTPEGLRRWMRGPAFVVTAGIIVALLLAAVTRGLSNTRYLIQVIQGFRPVPLHKGAYDPRGDFLFAYFAPMAVALASGLMLVAIGHRSLARRRNWRYWAFLVSKTALIVVLLSLVWVEGGHTLRAAIKNPTFSVLLGGVGFGIVYIGACGCGVLWSLADQRRRCPVCLHRLEMPVTLGSWGSVFDPATTELVCGEGHGSMSVLEPETAGPDRWVALDASWRSLFRGKSRSQDTIFR